MSSTSEEEGSVSGKNPLLINTVVKRMIGFLPVKDIKQCRFVCHEWNSVAEIFLRKRAKIRFTPLFRPSNFIEHFANSHLPDLPFTAFQFSTESNIRDGWTVEELLDFFEKWGKNIKFLEFINICVLEKKKSWPPVKRFDLNPMIDLMSSSLVQLKLERCFSPSFVVSLNKLAGVKFLSLIGGEVIVNSADNRIAPLKICIQGVKFHQNGERLEDVVVNDYVDFSKSSEIELFGSLGLPTFTNITFDMTRDIVRASRIHLSGTRLLNWKISNAKTEYLQLTSFRLKALTQMQMTQLYFENSTIDLTLLPKTIEKLTLKGNKYSPIGTDPLELPNLKYLNVIPNHDGRKTTFLRTYRILSLFANCLDLVDLELEGSLPLYVESYCELDVRWFPRTVKNVKIIRPMKFEFIGGEDRIDMNFLILEECSLEFAESVMAKIKPNVLVASIIGLIQPDILISFILTYTFVEKIVIEILEGLKMSESFENSVLSQYVDQYSRFYEFENMFGTSISQERFESYSRLIPPFFVFET